MRASAPHPPLDSSKEQPVSWSPTVLGIRSKCLAPTGRLCVRQSCRVHELSQAPSIGPLTDSSRVSSVGSPKFAGDICHLPASESSAARTHVSAPPVILESRFERIVDDRISVTILDLRVKPEDDSRCKILSLCSSSKLQDDMGKRLFARWARQRVFPSGD